jgi:hypothetical protein
MVDSLDRQVEKRARRPATTQALPASICHANNDLVELAALETSWHQP